MTVRSAWAENARGDLEETDPDEVVVLVPVGAIEQHGTHLPVGTDTLIVEAITRAAADRSDIAVTVPPHPFGYSPHHSGVPGTITLSSKTYLGVITDILNSLIDSGFTRLVIVNGHGGNRPLLKTAVTDVEDESDVSVAVVSYWDLVADEIESVRSSSSGGISHGGELETSLLLYLDEEMVGEGRADYVRNAKDGYLRTDLFGTGTVYYPRHFSEITDTGVSGIPSEASRKTGERVFESVVDALCTFITEYTDW